MVKSLGTREMAGDAPRGGDDGRGRGLGGVLITAPSDGRRARNCTRQRAVNSAAHVCSSYGAKGAIYLLNQGLQAGAFRAGGGEISLRRTMTHDATIRAWLVAGIVQKWTCGAARVA